MLSTATTANICARTCAHADCAHSESTNTALQLEALRRECADLKVAYSEMAASLWRAEQVIEHLEDEVAELKAGKPRAVPTATQMQGSRVRRDHPSLLARDLARRLGDVGQSRQAETRARSQGACLAAGPV